MNSIVIVKIGYIKMYKFAVAHPYYHLQVMKKTKNTCNKVLCLIIRLMKYHYC